MRPDPYAPNKLTPEQVRVDLVPGSEEEIIIIDASKQKKEEPKKTEGSLNVTKEVTSAVPKAATTVTGGE